jgi:hypothetical protein
MASNAFKQGMVELYQGEVLGEVFFDHMLSYFNEPDKQYKISVMPQLETETKARLRPTMMLLGLDLSEQNESRKTGLEMANSMKGLGWQDAMAMILAADASSEHRELAESMVVHEKSIYDFAEFELSGKGKKSIDAIVSQLHNKLPLP